MAGPAPCRCVPVCVSLRHSRLSGATTARVAWRFSGVSVLPKARHTSHLTSQCSERRVSVVQMSVPYSRFLYVRAVADRHVLQLRKERDVTSWERTARRVVLPRGGAFVTTESGVSPQFTGLIQPCPLRKCLLCEQEKLIRVYVHPVIATLEVLLGNGPLKAQSDCQFMGS